MNRIAILCFNKLRLSVECIQATLAAGYSEEAISIIDNGSLPEFEKSMLEQFPNIQQFRIHPNAGFAGGFTSGLKAFFAHYTDAQSVLFLTNDTRPNKGCLEACETTAQTTGAEMIAPQLFFRSDATRIDSIGAKFDRSTGTLHHCKTPDFPTLLETEEYIPGTALWISRNAFEQLGGTDPEYFMYWEDVDLSFRAHEKGILQARCYDAKIHHGVGQTCHKKAIYTTYYYQRNRIRFCKKWLSPKEWFALKPSIENDLSFLESKAAAKQDHQRINWLQKIRSEF